MPREARIQTAVNIKGQRDLKIKRRHNQERTTGNACFQLLYVIEVRRDVRATLNLMG
jgi:hypothetical protein